MTNNYMTSENKKTKIKYMSWECFNPTLSYYENKIRKKLNPKDFLQNGKQEFQAKVWKVSLENTAIWKTFGFQFEPVCTEQAHPNYSVGNPLQVQHDRLSTQEWCNCEK